MNLLLKPFKYLVMYKCSFFSETQYLPILIGIARECNSVEINIKHFNSEFHVATLRFSNESDCKLALYKAHHIGFEDFK